MPERDGAAVNVHLLRIDPELLQHCHRLDRKGFVQFEELDVLQVPADLVQEALHGVHWRHQNQLRWQTACRLTDDPHERGDAETLGSIGGHHDERRRAIVDRRGVAGGDGAVLLERGLQSGERLGGCVGSNRLVAVDPQRLALLLRDHNRQDLVMEVARLCRRRRLLVTERRVCILRLTRHRVQLGDGFPGVPHVDVLEGAPQPVVDHRVDDLAVAEAESFADARQQVRAVAHGLHAARDHDVDVAGGDPLRRQHHGLQAGAAHLVDRERRDMVRQSAAKRRLPCGILPEPRADDVPHDAFVDDGGIDAGAAHRFGDDQ